MISKIEEKYSEDKEVLDEKRKKEIKEMVEKHHDDPNTLAKMLAEKYGLEYVE